MASKDPVAKPVKATETSPVAAKPATASTPAVVTTKPAPMAPKAESPKVEAPKAEAPKPAPVAAKPAAPAKVEAKPVIAAKAVIPSAKPVEVKTHAKPEPVAKAAAPIIETPVAAVAVAIKKETKAMQDTITKTVDTAKKATAETTERAKAMFGDMNARTKDAVAKGTKAFEEMNEFTKGNIEAMVASSKIAAKGAEEIAKYSADYGRKAIEQANDNAKKLAAVKSPTEFFQLQSEMFKSSIDAMVTETSKFSESYLKLLGEIAQPVSNRVAVAVEKVKIAA